MGYVRDYNSRRKGKPPLRQLEEEMKLVVVKIGRPISKFNITVVEISKKYVYSIHRILSNIGGFHDPSLYYKVFRVLTLHNSVNICNTSNEKTKHKLK